MKRKLAYLFAFLAIAIPVAGITSAPAVAMNDPGQESFSSPALHCDAYSFNGEWSFFCYFYSKLLPARVGA